MCPLTYSNLFPDKKCNWSGNSKLLMDHLKVHQEEFLNPPQFEWPENGQNKIFFTTVGKSYFYTYLDLCRYSDFII